MKEDWKLHHLGLVIKDMDKAVEYFESLGIGEIGPEEVLDRRGVSDYQVFGHKPKEDKTLARQFKVGPITINLLQPVVGETATCEFMRDRGEGLNHVCLLVDDLEKETRELTEKGVLLMESMTSVGNHKFDTRKVGNMFLELLQWTPERAAGGH